MTLLEVRQKFIELSGREDLATTTVDDYDTDAGADFFIQLGSDYLDFKTEHDREEAAYEATLSAGGYSVDLLNCRTVKSVWYESDDGWIQLDFESEADLREDYPDWDSSDTGAPLYWTQHIGRRVPSQVASGLAIKYKEVIVMPPTEEDVTIRIEGIFHSYPLSDNDDINFWSQNYPGVLVWAALRALEASYRNTQGVLDWERAMEPYIRGIGNDDAAFIGDEPSEMEG